MFDYWLWDGALPKWFCEEQIKNTDWSKKQIGKVAKDEDFVVNKEKRITDFKIFTITQLRKIIVYNKKDDGSYYVSNYPNKKKDEIIRLLTEYKDKIKIPDDL